MKSVFSIFFGAIFIATLAQEPPKTLRVEYKTITKFNLDSIKISVDGGGKSGMLDHIKKQMAESFKKPKHFELLLYGNESTYQQLEQINNDQPSQGGIQISFAGGTNRTLYRNTQLKIQKKNASYPTSYLIVDSLEKPEWKITREKAFHCGLRTVKAVWDKDENTRVTAWFAPQLRFQSGPEDLWGLPGLILSAEEIKMSNGVKDYEKAYECDKIDIPEKEIKLDIPEKGKVVNSQEYEAILKEQSEKFRKMYGGGVDTED